MKWKTFYHRVVSLTVMSSNDRRSRSRIVELPMFWMKILSSSFKNYSRSRSISVDLYEWVYHSFSNTSSVVTNFWRSKNYRRVLKLIVDHVQLSSNCNIIDDCVYYSFSNVFSVVRNFSKFKNYRRVFLNDEYFYIVR